MRRSSVLNITTMYMLFMMHTTSSIARLFIGSSWLLSTIVYQDHDCTDNSQQSSIGLSYINNTADIKQSTVKDNKVIHRDVVIIGSGPAGLTASIYTARALLKPLQISGYNAGGQLMLTSDVENFPGYRDAISGPDLINDLTHQARKFGTDIWQLDCGRVDLSKRPFELTVKNCTITANALIISTGANALWLGAEREVEFQGRGISTCATCDGYLFRDKSVVVVGGGDSAMEEANFLTRFARDVTIVHRREHFRASKVQYLSLHHIIQLLYCIVI
jgi:thioredoxin reductase